MPRHARTYTVQDATGTAKELYAWITAGLENPPTETAFETRLKRAEKKGDDTMSVAELRRPPSTYSARARKAKEEGGRKGGRLRRKKKETKVEGAIPAQAHNGPSTTQEPITTQKAGREIKEVWGKPYFRKGSLDAWPKLKILEAA